MVSLSTLDGEFIDFFDDRGEALMWAIVNNVPTGSFRIEEL